MSDEKLAERRLLDEMDYDERQEYEKNKREEEVYLMLQEKYGFDDEQMNADLERLRLSTQGE